MATVLSYRATLTAPLIVTAPGGDPNSAATRGYLPGSLVRGALASGFLRRNPSADAASDPGFRELFLSGRVRFLNAYPRGRSDRRSIPAPLSLRVERGRDRPVYDLASPDAEEAYLDLGEDRTRRLESLGHSFVRLAHPAIFFRTPGTAVNFHHQRDRQAGRPVAGGIFTYIAIQPGESFVGHVLVEDDARIPALAEMLTRTWRGGRSKGAEYGGVQVEVLRVTTRQAWSEVPDPPAGVLSGRIVVTLLSDYLDDGPAGQATPATLTAVLRRAGVPLRVDRHEPLCSHHRASIQGGYLSVWHLPLPQSQAIAAGSVLVYELDGELSADLRERLEWEGVGARRAEGFGRLCFARHGAELEFTTVVEDDSDSAAVPARVPERRRQEADAVLRRMRTGLLRDALDRRLLQRADDVIEGTPDGYSPSVLGRLRARVRTAQGPEQITAWVDHCQGKKAAKTLEQVRLRPGPRPLSRWISDLLADAGGGADARVWQILDARALCDSEAILDERDRSLECLREEDLIWTYQRRLLDATLTRLIVKAKEASE